jgi:hypothetical protein
MPRPAHALPAEEVAQRLLSDLARGLGAEEAHARLAHHGPNELEQAEGVSAARILLEQLTAPMILLLAGAGVLSAALGDVTEAVVIFVVVALNAWIGFRQEYRAEKAMAALQAMATPPVSLVRDGSPQQLRGRSGEVEQRGLSRVEPQRLARCVDPVGGVDPLDGIELLEHVRVRVERHLRRVPGLASDVDHVVALRDQQ